MGVHFFSTVTNSSEVVIWTVGSGRRAIPYHSFDRCNYPRHAVPYVAFVMRVRSRVRVVALGRGVCCVAWRGALPSRGRRRVHTEEEETTAPCRKYFQVCPSAPSYLSRHGRQSRRDMRTEYGKPESRVLSARRRVVVLRTGPGTRDNVLPCFRVVACLRPRGSALSAIGSSSVSPPSSLS